MLIDRIIFLLAPSPFVASQLGLSYFDSERRRHLIDGQPGLLDLYNAVADDEEIRLRVVVREGGLSMGLKEIDEALRQMFLRRDLTDVRWTARSHPSVDRALTGFARSHRLHAGSDPRLRARTPAASAAHASFVDARVNVHRDAWPATRIIHGS